jgi:hypothetical protein
MTLCVSTRLQRLIIEAGGVVQPGTTIKQYLWRLCRELAAVGVEVTPRTLERAWRPSDGYISERVWDALKKVASKRALNEDLKLITDIEAVLDKIEPKGDAAPHLYNIRIGLHWLRTVVSFRHRMDVMAGCIQLSAAAEREAESQGAE